MVAHERDFRRPAGAIGVALGAYGLLVLVALVVGVERDAPNLFVCAPWPVFRAPWGHLASLGLGLVLAVVIVATTRFVVRATRWGRALHEDLRPAARALGPGAIVPLAVASSLGEELLFRGALVPALGVVASSLLFGVVHQVRGRSRLVWCSFAAIVGLAFAAVFRATGSLLGPLLAHAVVNATNLRFLIEHEPRR